MLSVKGVTTSKSKSPDLWLKTVWKNLSKKSAFAFGVKADWPPYSTQLGILKLPVRDLTKDQNFFGLEGNYSCSHSRPQSHDPSDLRQGSRAPISFPSPRVFWSAPRHSCLGADQETRGLWERDCESSTQRQMGTFFGSRGPISRAKIWRKRRKQPMSRKIYEENIETLIEICKRKRK